MKVVKDILLELSEPEPLVNLIDRSVIPAGLITRAESMLSGQQMIDLGVFHCDGGVFGDIEPYRELYSVIGGKLPDYSGLPVYISYRRVVL